MRRRISRKIYSNILAGKCTYRARTGGRAVRLQLALVAGTLSDAELFTLVRVWPILRDAMIERGLA